MSAHSSLTGTVMAGSWPMARVMAGLSAVPIDHAIDLAFFFPDQGQVRQESLIAETRRHLGGCVAAIETALRLSLGHVPDVASALDRLPGPAAWAMIQAHPTLIEPALLMHMQMRAGVTLMLRQFGRADAEQQDAIDVDRAVFADDPALGEAFSALMLAEGRWLAAGGEDTPLRADMPAEYFAELLWTVAACLTRIAQQTMPDGEDRLLAAVDRSGWALLADHDEAACPIAQADRLVRRMGAQADAPELLGQLLGQRRFLPFVAVAARRLHLASDLVARMLVLGPMAQVAMLCRALGGSGGDYRHLLLSLRPVRPFLSDAIIVMESERYEVLTECEADAAISALRTAPAFRAKLDHLRMVAGA